MLFLLFSKFNASFSNTYNDKNLEKINKRKVQSLYSFTFYVNYKLLADFVNFTDKMQGQTIPINFNNFFYLFDPAELTNNKKFKGDF